MTSTSDSFGTSDLNSDDQQKRLEHYATVLREYAKWSLLRGWELMRRMASPRAEGRRA